MMNNIAVVLRGHIRTWEYNSRIIFDFYDSIAHNVDYYVSTWNTPEMRVSKIVNGFKRANKTPTAFLKVGYQSREYTSWAGPALLSLHLLPHMRQKHKMTPYDAVFDSRLDVAAGLAHEDVYIPPIQKDTLYTTQFTNLIDKNGDRNIGMMDHMLVSQFNVFESMVDRIIINSRDTRECHVDMLDFAKKQGFSVSNCLRWMKTRMVRPSDCFRVVNPKNVLDGYFTPLEDPPEWEQCTIEQRKLLCSKLDIELSDYITNNGNISVEQPSDQLFERLKSAKSSD